MSGLGNKEIMAKNIKKYMQLLGKDRNQICKDLGISYSTFSDWVNAKKYPRIDKIELMADYFGVKKADLVEADTENQSRKTSTYVDLFSGIGGLKNAMRIKIGDTEVTMRSESLYRLVENLVEMNEKDIELLADTAERINPKRKKNVIVVSNPNNLKTPPSMKDKNSLVPFPQYPTVTNKDIDEFAARNAKKKFTREEIAEMLHEMKQEDE